MLLTCDGIRAQIASLNTVFEPPIFSAVLIDQALISKVSMAMGSMTIDDAACGVFEARVFSSGVSAIAAGQSKGVTAEHLVHSAVPHHSLKGVEALSRLPLSHRGYFPAYNGRTH